MLEDRIDNVKFSNLKNYFLCKLIKGELLKTDILNMAAEYCIQTDSPGYSVAIVRIENYDDLELNLSDADLQIEKFAIKNILEENVEIHGYGYLFEISDRDYGIILTGNIGQHKNDDLNRIISEFTGLIKKYTSDEMLMIIGEPVNSIFEVGASYKKALALMETEALNNMVDLNKGRNNLDEILQYIQLHFREDINLKRLSEIFYISSVYLGQLFRSC